jgi:hypothetical protein
MEAIGIGSTFVSMATSALGALAGAQKEKFDAESRRRTAEIQAAQTDTIALGDLKRQLGNIKAIRASADARIDAPTSEAIIESERAVSNVNRRRALFSYQNEANMAKVDEGLYDDFAFLSLLGTGAKGLAQFGGYG